MRGKARHRIEITEVGGDSLSLATLFPDLPGHCLDFGCGTGDQRYLSAGTGKGFSRRLADTTSGAGHQRGLAAEIEECGGIGKHRSSS